MRRKVRRTRLEKAEMAVRARRGPVSPFLALFHPDKSSEHDGLSRCYD